MDLITISDDYWKTASDFLKESELISVLEKYGKIKYEGAHASKVMLHGDVDIKVIKDADFTQDEIFTDQGKLNISQTNLTKEQRLKILEFKQYRKDLGLKVSGQEIYEAVIEKGITDPESVFKKCR